MFAKIKRFFNIVFESIAEAQMARANEIRKNRHLYWE